jgi:hypothetical protein
MVAVACCHPAGAAPVTLDAVARGWFTSDGIANFEPGLDDQRNYLVGDKGTEPHVPRQVNRNFFVFDLGGVIGDITGASLNLFNPPDGFSSQDAFETYVVFDVSTDISTLITHITGPTGLAIYDDLGTGSQYGRHTSTIADNDRMVTIPLNAAALAALNQASGLFAFGGAITSLDEVDNDEFLFGFSGIRQRLGTQLVLEGVVLVPEPNTGVLSGLALLWIAVIAKLNPKRREE